MALENLLLGKHSTAIEALRGRDLTGMKALVTGGNSGIGKETVRSLALAGADVVLCSRDEEAGKRAAENVRQTGVKGVISVMQLDLASFASIRSLAEEICTTMQQLDLLILNAGIFALPYCTRTLDGLEMQIGVNHVGHHYLTKLLLPVLKKSLAARVIVVASIGHKGGGLDVEDLNWQRRNYNPWLAYSQSKLANILFAKELARRLEQEGTPVKAYALHPGIISTNLSRHVCGLWLFRCVAQCFCWIKTVQQGAATTVYAATAPELDSHSGAYLKDCKLANPSSQAQDPELAKMTWEKTEELIQNILMQNMLSNCSMDSCSSKTYSFEKIAE